MYLPKNKILVNLYTNGGEFVKKSTKLAYVGFYHKLYNGNIFTGKNPEDSPIEELVKVNPNEGQENLTSEIALIPKDPSIFNSNQWIFEEIINYRISTGKSLTDIESKKIPNSYFPQLKEKDYELGEFQRYFLKKINEEKYVEVNKVDYNAIKSKDLHYFFEVFLPISISWIISGNRVKVLEVNQKTIKLTQQKLKIKGLDLFLQQKYDKFYQYPARYNLITEGGELVDISNNNYIGDYNIDKVEGFKMLNETKLYPINLIIENQLFEKILKNNTENIVEVYNSLKKK